MVRTVRDGKKVVPTCSECGCRLEDTGYGDWVHFGHITNYLSDTDARGCKCSLVNMRFVKFADGWKYTRSTATLGWQSV